MSAKTLAALLIGAALLLGVDPAADVDRKIDLIESGKARPGSMITFPAADLNAWVRVKSRELVPEGLRQPRLTLAGGAATGTAVVDFVKLRHAAGMETNWLISKLLQGEKPVQVTATIRSAHGQATVHPVRVEIGGLAVSGATLDFLIQAFLLPTFPNAVIDEPFPLASGVDRIDVTPDAAWVYMKGERASVR